MRPDPRWTAGRPASLPDEGLHQTVARIAAAHPDATALVAGARTVSYGELDRTADGWAADLAGAGVEAGDLVPILLPRGTDLVVALLAVLKTGAAYALLDPSWPRPRLAAILDQLDAPLLVRDTRAAEPLGLPVWTPPRRPVRAGFRPVEVDGGAPCCVFFTSGTTGRPKGVLSPHRATARLFGAGSFARFDTGTTVPVAAAVGWDAFSLELWAGLLSGGRCVLVTEPYLTADELRRGIDEHGVETAWLTSSLFDMVVDEDPDAFRGLRQLMIGGERLSAGHVRRFLRRHPDVTLLNGYGPVESTVFATTHRIVPADCDRDGGIPLGRPVSGTEVHVLAGYRPCEVGETGEICVAGAGLALRYLDDPELTAAKFPEVWLGGRAVRLYRTGDLGRWDSDGLLHYLGRADRQVKLRGHRVEPAEVERQIEALLPVRACRVLARRDAGGAVTDLLAFCVPSEPGDPLDEAAGTLAGALAPYHRPAAVLPVAGFPRTAQGKLDERALLALAPAAAPAGAPPVDRTARLVAEVVAQVLGRDRVPLDVPFVDLGGSSLAAGRVCARLAARLGRPVPVSLLYEHPTPTGLADRLRSADPVTDPVADPVADDAVPLSPMQLVYLTRRLLDPADLTGHCLLTWVVRGEPDRAALTAAVASVHARHEPLRAAYLADPRPVARLVDVPPPPLEVLPEQPSVPAALGAVRELLSEELLPEEADVWRVALAPAGEASVLGCAVHHIAFDGWSESLLARDLADAYRAARGCSPARRPAPPSLRAVHRLGTDRLRRGVRRREEVRAELAGVPALHWPDGPVGAAGDEPVLVEIPLPHAVVAGVDRQAAAAGVSRFVALLQHYGAALAEVTGQDDFAIGVPVAQRDAPGLEDALGCHLTMLCLRLRRPALGDGTGAVQAAGEIARRAFARQDVPLPDVLAADPRAHHRSPVFQTLFALQDNAVPTLDLDGLPADFVRQPYLQLPVELHAELWPEDGGGLRLAVSARPEAVPAPVAADVAKRFTDRLERAAAGGRP